MLSFPEYEIVILTITGIYTLTFVLFIFLYRLKIGDKKESILSIADCFTNLPLMGFLFVGISILIAVLLYLFNLQDPVAEIINKIIPADISVFGLFLIIALVTSFSTELLSNTAVQIGLFVIVLPLSTIINFSAVEALIIVTLSSTCAFMSPIATGVNGLAFGGVKDVSLKMMLIVGFAVNLAGAVLISLWVRFVVSFVLNNIF